MRRQCERSPNSAVGGFAGANAEFINFLAGSIPESSFPVGTITNSTASGTASAGAGSVTDPFIALNNPNSASNPPAKLFTGGNRGKYISVAAPGVDILVPAPKGDYQITTGTSVAAAEVSGIVALLLERNPKLTPADIRRI